MSRQPPGLLRASADPDVVMMICTAGHVDHGKTSLVRLLTGCNTDRLKAEQERGLTIELGFAPCVLGGDLCVGIVDVPGHEKFVRNMVAGVSGIGMTVLVIAADDGIMPQTIEHFQIMDLLGVREGIVALTKIDLVSEERVAEVSEDIEIFLAETFMEGAPVLPLSSETGEGVFAFYDVLVERIRSIAKQRKRGIFRMPIERVFVQKGFGSVVTGIPVDGTVRIGAELELVPGGQTCKVRGLQRFLRDASEGGYGQCLAINASEFSKSPPVRGQVLCVPGRLRPARHFYVHLRAVETLGNPLENASSVKLHTGTAEQIGRLYLLEGKTLAKGEGGFGVITLDEAIAAAPHDRFILRRPSPAATVAGGEILFVSDAAHRERKKQALARLIEYHALFQGVDPASPEGVAVEVEYLLRTQRPVGSSLEDAAKATLLPGALVRESVSRLPKVRALGNDSVIHEDAYRACLAEAEARVDAAAEAKQPSLSLSDLRKGLEAWPGALWDAIMKDLEQGKRATVRGNKLILQDALAKLSKADRDLMARLVAAYEDTGFSSPRPEELPALLGAPHDRIARLLEHLYNDGTLVRLAKNVVLSYNSFKKAQDLVVQTIQDKGALDSADFKYAIGSTRKYALAILDYLDARKVTVRIGNDRKLGARYQRNLVE